MGKNSRRRVGRRADLEPAAEVRAGGEARLGLEPTTRRVWWPRGCRPTTGGRTKDEWLSVYGFARPRTGETFTLIQPRVNAERMADALAAFAAQADPEGKKVLVLVAGDAGWHRAKRLPVPANARLHFLPPCTPELQSVEPFWVLVREAMANDTFDRLTNLHRRVVRRCRRLAEDRATVLGAVGFH